MTFAALLFVQAAAGAAPPAAEGVLLGRVDHVADGDTLTVRVDGERHRVRLHQIDAPEHAQPGAAEARRALAAKVDGRYVRLRVETVDDYGRLVAGVSLGERDINRELVREGHAWAFRRYLEDRSLLDDEAAARRAGRGLWALADPVAPWAWRQQQRDHAVGARPDCRIKGNITRGGERIYHRPGDRHYAQTRISTSRGERWFCSEREAREAGWRAPR
jgi:endonuclease YncB( thermonuclease family)